MCWSERVSWFSFIVGTAVNVWVASLEWGSYKSQVLALCALWQWVLLVQVAEAFIWKGNNTQNESMVRNASAAQYLLIITQPLVLGLAFFALMSNIPNKFYVASFLGAYALWCMYSIWKVPDMGLTKPGCSNNHLEMTWWKKIPGGVYPYLLAIALLVFWLIKPTKAMWWSMAFVFGTLLLSSLFYSCGTGSMWCWFAVSAPLVTWLIFKDTK